MIRACPSIVSGFSLGLTPMASLASTVHNAAADFSATSNPNGVWSFGSEYPTLGTGFALNTLSGTVAGLDYWGSGAFLPAAFHNPTGAPILYGGSQLSEAGMLILHPGPLGEYSIARFTAPTSGYYEFSASFIGQDLYGTSTDVHLLKDGVSLFDDAIAGFHDTASSGTFGMSLLVGDTLDAAVGRGANGTYFNDSTGLNFGVESVSIPLPPAGWLGLSGVAAAAGLGIIRRRRA